MIMQWLTIGKNVVSVAYIPNQVDGSDGFLVVRRGIVKKLNVISSVIGNDTVPNAALFTYDQPASRYDAFAVVIGGGGKEGVRLYCLHDDIEAAKKACLEIYLEYVGKTLERYQREEHQLKLGLRHAANLLHGKLSHAQLKRVAEKVTELFGDALKGDTTETSAYYHSLGTSRNRCVTTVLSRSLENGTVTYRDVSGGHPESEATVLHVINLSPDLTPTEAIQKLEKLIAEGKAVKAISL